MSNKIRVLIVDDEPLARRGICQLLEREKDFLVAGEASNGQKAASMIETHAPDLVFLDIQMPVVDGFSFIEKLNAENLPEIVFVTAFDEHAIQAFEAGAIDYVLKPINAERFRKTLERVRHRVLFGENRFSGSNLQNLLSNLKISQENFLERISVRENEKIRFLEINKIEWISSHGNYIEINSGGEKFLVRETMDNFEKKLNPHDFVRIRRSKIVRIEQIEEMHPLFNGEFELVLKSGSKFSSSRRYRKNLDALLKS